MYFIRHGQAGSRQDYDCLSDLGREQSGLLGTWLARHSIHFGQAWSGHLSRQRETADRVRRAYQLNGADFPEIASSACWDEFDLDAVYRGIGPQLARDDHKFRLQFEELQRESLQAGSSVHRTWAECDITVVRAWIDGRYQYHGESFEEFVARVRSGAKLLQDNGNPCNVAVFTSATPAAIWAAMALNLDDIKVMQLAGVTYNTSLTVIRGDREAVRLVQFNTVPHLDAPELLTHR